MLQEWCLQQVLHSAGFVDSGFSGLDSEADSDFALVRFAAEKNSLAVVAADYVEKADVADYYYSAIPDAAVGSDPDPVDPKKGFAVADYYFAAKADSWNPVDCVNQA